MSKIDYIVELKVTDSMVSTVAPEQTNTPDTLYDVAHVTADDAFFNVSAAVAYGSTYSL